MSLTIQSILDTKDIFIHDQHTIFPKVDTKLPIISKCYRFNGGIATVQVDCQSNYDMIINGSRFSSQENSAKRDADYKPAVSDISKNGDCL